MSPLPKHLINRWQNRPDSNEQHGVLYWHILLGEHPQVQAIARMAQERLSKFDGLHMTPLKWLHITTLVVGSADDISGAKMTEILTKAALSLSKTPRIRVSIDALRYHPEAIVLTVQPKDSLRPVFDAAKSATSAVIGTDQAVIGADQTAYGNFASWKPHVTLCYSTRWQPAEPIISTLGNALPSCEVTIDALSLVVQRGQERLWDWHSVGQVPLSPECAMR